MAFWFVCSNYEKLIKKRYFLYVWEGGGVRGWEREGVTGLVFFLNFFHIFLIFCHTIYFKEGVLYCRLIVFNQILWVCHAKTQLTPVDFFFMWYNMRWFVLKYFAFTSWGVWYLSSFCWLKDFMDLIFIYMRLIFIYILGKNFW